MKDHDLDPAKFSPGQTAWRIIEDGDQVGLVAHSPPDWATGSPNPDVIKWMPRWVLLETAKPYRATHGFPYIKRDGDAHTDLHEVRLLTAETICFEFRVKAGPGSGHPMPVVVSRAGVEDTARTMSVETG